MGSGVLPVLCVFLIVHASIGGIGAVQMEDVYFSNSDDIEVLENNEIRVVFERADTSILETMDCNPNPSDRRIYWISGSKDGRSGAIKRGFPDNNGSMEIVLDTDIHEPKGIAVDWSTNNIYFSHIVSGGTGRVEVVSVDGRNRRVLFYGFMAINISPATGAVAVNVMTGYLYFIDSMDIDRCYLDGSHRERVVTGQLLDMYDGLTIDEETNVLYWTVKIFGTEVYYIRSLPISGGAQGVSGQIRSQLISRVHDVFVYNQSMYLTVPSLSSTGTDPGEILLVDVGLVSWSTDINLQVEVLHMQNSSFDPRGVCTFKNVTGVSSPCSNTSLCDPSAFCFTIPDGRGGTTASCGCSTGITLNSENNMTCASVPEEFLLYSRRLSIPTKRSEIRIIPLEGADPTSFVDVLLPFDLYRTNTVHVAYDILYHKVYWTEWSPPSIKRANFNGTQVEVFINSSIAHPEGIAVDPYAGNLYWADSRLNIISVTSLANPCYRKTLFDDVDHPQGLALDVIRGFMYWTDVRIREPVVERALLNGQERVRISPEGNALSPTNIAVDLETGDVYWIKFNRDESSADIVRYTQNREEVLNLKGHVLGMPFGVAVHRDYVYWTDRGNNIARIDKTGSGIVETVDTQSGEGLIAVNNTHAATSFNTMCRASTTCNQLCFQSQDSPPVSECACSDHFTLDPSKCRDSVPSVYVAFPSSIKELTYAEDVFGLGDDVEGISLMNGTVKAMDADFMEKMVYWIDSTDKTIKRQHLNGSSGSGFEVVINCCLWEPEDIAVDWLGRNIYWTDSARRVIEVSTLKGSSRVVLLEVDESYGPPGHIVLDPIRGHIYWTSTTEPKIYRSMMDGSESVPSLFVQFTAQPSASITALTMDLNKVGGNLYWAVNETDNSGNVVYQVYSKMLGSDIEEFFKFGASQGPRINDLQTAMDHVYYTLDGGGRSAIANLSFLSNLLYSGFAPNLFSQFLLLHHSTQPGKHVCQVSSQCEGAESLCLVSDEFSRQCRCDALRTREMAGQTDDDRFQCTSSNHFLLLATDHLIHYLPLPDDDGPEPAVHRLPATPKGTVADIAFDPVNNSVMWVTNGGNQLSSVKLDSSAAWSIPISVDPLHPFSLAYDWRGGHVFLTERDSFEIKMAVTNGEGRGTMLETMGGRVTKPGQVLMDSNAGVLYYTIRDGLSNESRSLREVSLREVSQSKELPLNNSQIGKLTFDEDAKVFYWIRYRPGHKEGDVIEKFLLSNMSTVEVAAGASQVEALGAFSVKNADDPILNSYLYWYNRTDGYLYRHDVAALSTTRYLRWELPASTKVVRIIGHNNRTTLMHPFPCLANQRPCSHLCVQTHATPTCYCPLHTSPEEVQNVPNAVCRPNRDCGSGVTFPCNDEFGSCFPRTYFCDGLQHCSNGADERNCRCNTTYQQGCFTNPDQCYNFTERCDGKNQCDGAEDEADCCHRDHQFGCFVRGKAANQVYFDCLDILSRCDDEIDCINGSDERDCPGTTDVSTLDVSPPPSSSVTVSVVITLVIISVITIVVVVVIVISVVRLVWKGRKQGHHSITYLSQTPHDSTSDYSSEVSHMTNTTQMSHCGHNKPVGLTNQMNMLNPPPSPNSTLPRHSLPVSEDDDISRLSQSLSEYVPPPPPCPSINYDDDVSMSMSISVSQSRYPASMNAGGGGPSHHYHYPNTQHHYTNTQHHHQYHHSHQQPYAGGVARQSGRNPNPLLSTRTTAYQQQNHYVPFNGDIPYHERERNVGPQCHQSNHLAYNLHQRGGAPYSDISEQDTITQLETESTLSMPMDNPDDGYPYDVSMPHLPPPGRPSSPVTVCSEYHGQPPLSPELSRRSSSTSSFSSQD